MDAATITLVTGSVIGATELVNRAFDRDWRAVVKILTAVFIGALAVVVLATATLGIGVAIFTGIGLGLTSAGVVATATRIG